MKKLFSSFIDRIRSISEWLHETKIIRRIGITYQVFWNLFLIFLIFGLMSVFFAGGAAAGYFASLVADEPLRSESDMLADIYNYEETSEIYFADNTYLGKVPTEFEREEVDLENISDHVVHALIATEDEHFFEHDGVVPKAIMRAVLQEVANSSVQTGGSTLTQQLIKQQILSSEVSFDRKATEILLAMRLEHFMDKQEILEAYLNVVPFGRNASGRQIGGVQAAAQGIFGVDASELNIPQSAFIAGLPQSPFAYTPFNNDGSVKESFDAGINRMKSVLRNMHDNGYISEDEYNEALEYDVREHLTDRTPSPLEKYPYLTDDIMRRSVDILMKAAMEEDEVVLSEIEDPDERQEVRDQYIQKAAMDLRRKGYVIHSTIDKDLYDGMQEALMNNSHLFGNDRSDTDSSGNSYTEQEEIAFVLLDNSTGKILSFVGGRDEQNSTNNYNYATQAQRSTGSTMKPLLAYAPAMEVGVAQPGFVIPDTEDRYVSGGKPITNFDNRYKGLMTVRDSVAESRNVPAVRAFRATPSDVTKDIFDKLEFKHFEDALPESTALGPIDISVEKNVNAYATFANGGKHVSSYMIEKIETKDGEVIFEHEKDEVEVYSPQTSYLMLDMMRDVLRGGGGTARGIPNQLKFSADWAGKTGTSQFAKDYWFVATNPNVSLGVWIGYPSNAEKATLQSTGAGTYSQRTQAQWARMANAIYDIRPELIAPNERFQQPEGIVSRSVCTLTGTLASKACQDAGYVKSELFNSKFVPTKQDDSTAARFVTINGKNYKALDSTPKEFTDQGLSVSFDLWNIDNISSYLPENMKNIVPNQNAPSNGDSPGKVSGVSLGSSTLSWSKHGRNDIVGYRIYQASNGSDDFKKIADVKGNETTSYNVNGGSNAYYVIAVTTTGKQSSPSDIASGSDWISKEEQEQEEQEKQEEQERKEEEERKKQEEKEKKEEEKKKEEERKKEEQRKKEEEKKKEEERKKEEEQNQNDEDSDD
ncbi:transglycosylase domain-containing protein [Alkalihalobacillus trypoxylicola]|uniref:Penicillin-binding protein n=1 Tax=Alkalihalobacillus trypoxylicola TaxID=519424 RepID=A0A161QDY8_9BACI|nr:transglycosylase domain-containing protein [Alkalihalobacillus trypoxylicola]KYG26687.1 penicillin-binding protein [Alkalihalobacillus trypoxylicola]